MKSYRLLLMTKNRISLPLDKYPNIYEIKKRTPLIWQRAGGTQECWEGEMENDVITGLTYEILINELKINKSFTFVEIEDEV